MMMQRVSYDMKKNKHYYVKVRLTNNEQKRVR